MGIQDTVWFKVTCEKCGTTESHRAHDRGYNRISWDEPASFTSFAVVSSGGGMQDPDIESATCKECGGAATVKSSYGFEAPKGW